MFLVKFTVSEQCTPDDWEMTSKEKLFPEETTLSEINDWVLSKGGFIHSKDNSQKRMIEVRLSEPEI